MLFRSAEAKAHAEAVLRAYDSLMTERHEFAPGDLVQWKLGMRSYGGLPYGGPQSSLPSSPVASATAATTMNPQMCG